MSLKFIQKSHKTFLRFPDTLTQYFTLEKNGPHCISLLPTVFSLIHEFCVRLLCQKTVRKMGKSVKIRNTRINWQKFLRQHCKWSLETSHYLKFQYYSTVSSKFQIGKLWKLENFLKHAWIVQNFACQ